MKMVICAAIVSQRHKDFGAGGDGAVRVDSKDSMLQNNPKIHF